MENNKLGTLILKGLALISYILFCFVTYAQTQNSQYQNILPDDKKMELDSEYKKMYEKEKVDKVKLLEQLEQYKASENEAQYASNSQTKNANNTLNSVKKNNFNPQDVNKMLDGYNNMLNQTEQSAISNSAQNEGVSPAPITAQQQNLQNNKVKNNGIVAANSSSEFATQATAFNVSGYGGAQTVLPVGSVVHVTFLTGLEAVKGKERDLLFEADTVFDGPNGKKIDLRNCRITAKGQADLSIERVIIIPSLISCVRSDGAYFDRPIEGFVAGKDNSYGQIGLFQSKQGQVFLQALIAKVVGATSSALSAAETTTSLAAGNTGAAISGTNVTGDKLKYGILSGTGQAAEMVTQWYLDQAKELLPSIATPSGAKGWVVITRAIQIPSLNSSK